MYGQYKQCRVAMRVYVRALTTFCTVTALGMVIVYTIFLSGGKRASIRRDHRVEFNVDHAYASELQSIPTNGHLDQSQVQRKEQEDHLDQQEARTSTAVAVPVVQQEGHLDQQEDSLDQQEADVRTSTAVDQQEGHLDQQEDSLDQQEADVLRTSTAVDQQEGHLDQQEADVRTSTAVAVPVGIVSISSSEKVATEHLSPTHLTIGAQSSRPQTEFQSHVPRKSVTFTTAKDFTFPHPRVFKSVGRVLSSDWVRQLKSYLLSITPARQVTVTVASYDFAANLLNWLISAQVVTSPPLENILVVSFDNLLHRMLISREISSLFVPYVSVLRNPNGMGAHKIWMTRLAVIRLISHWGFNVAQFDTDAIILRNPQPLFDRFPSFDVVGSRAKLPFELGKGQWGFTVCMGAILFRSTPRTESLWRAMGNLKMLTADDQYRLNFALLSTGLKWSNKELRNDKENTGIDRNGVEVVVLPPIYICRGLCVQNRSIDYYVWHEAGGGHTAGEKVLKDSKSNLWFLRRDWKTLLDTSSLMGRKLLESLTLTGSHSRPHL